MRLSLAIPFFCLPSAGFAQLPDVAITAAWSTSCNSTDVQMKLMATGRFASVDIIDVKAATPTLVDLASYEAVIVWSNSSFDDGVAMGDLMADYVDAGGGVVVSTFANSTTTANRFLEGRWLTGGYEVIETQSGNTSGASSLGTVHQPGHPVMVGVSTLSASFAFRPTTTNLVQGTLLAEWADGKILAAAGTMPGRVDLGLLPPSTDCNGIYWDATGDGALLMANALEFVAGDSNMTTFCDPADVNSTGQPTQLGGALGSGVGSGLHLESAQGPPGQFGYLLIGTGAVDPGMPVSNGHLCLDVAPGQTIGRYNIVGGALNSVGQFDSMGVFQNIVGTSTVTSGFDVPSSIPTIGGTIAIGQTWNFQLWHRENGGFANFSNGLTVQF